MRHWIVACALGVATTVVAAPASAQPPGSTICNQLAGPLKGVGGLPPRTRSVFDVCYDGETWRVQPPPNPRLTNKDPVWVRVRHFNFLRYTLSFNIEEEKSESYGFLAKLWSGILNPSVADILGGLGPGATPPSNLIALAADVYRTSQETQRRIAAAVQPHRKPGLSLAEVATLTTSTNNVRTAVQAMNDAYQKLQTEAETPAGFQAAFVGTGAKYYQVAIEHYGAATSAADTFLALADRSLGDEVKKIGTKDAGTRVTVTLLSTDPNGVKDEFETIHYVSQSSMPLVAHGGLAFAGIKDVTFDKVKRAAQFSEEDVFQQRGSGDNSSGFALFLSWQFWEIGGSSDQEAKQQPVTLLASLGTDIKEPGKKVFAGPSAMLFGRAVVTTGVALGRKTAGEQPIEPNIFRIIQDRGTTSWFLSLTFRVY